MIPQEDITAVISNLKKKPVYSVEEWQLIELMRIRKKLNAMGGLLVALVVLLSIWGFLSVLNILNPPSYTFTSFRF